MIEYQLLRHRVHPEIHQLAEYQRLGGFAAFRKCVTGMPPEKVTEEVAASGLRGRGGAGFSTGQKWRLLTPGVFPRYFVANGDESEPGTFKDREILERNPFQFLEGLMIASYACQANLAFVYLRGEFSDLARKVEENITSLYAAGLLGEQILGSTYNLDLFAHLGAGAYICGEESALLESIEGKRGQPRYKPPFPVQKGLYQQPTVINNVETLTNIPVIFEHGAQAYRQVGTEKSPGVKVFSLSGNVARPGNYELPLGTAFRTLIEECGGGVGPGRKLKGILPSGAASCVLPATDEVLDCPMDYESVSKLGASLGSGSVILVDDSVDPAWLAWKTIRFFEHESCGKCTPCRAGLPLLRQMLEDVRAGDGSAEMVLKIKNLAETIQRGSLCGLGQAAPNVALSSMRLFPEAFDRPAGSQS